MSVNNWFKIDYNSTSVSFRFVPFRFMRGCWGGNWGVLGTCVAQNTEATSPLMALEKIDNRYYLRKRLCGRQVEISLRTDKYQEAKTRANRFVSTAEEHGLEAAKAQLTGKKALIQWSLILLVLRLGSRKMLNTWSNDSVTNWGPMWPLFLSRRRTMPLCTFEKNGKFIQYLGLHHQ